MKQRTSENRTSENRTSRGPGVSDKVDGLIYNTTNIRKISKHLNLVKSIIDLSSFFIVESISVENMDSAEMLRSNQPIVQLRSKLSEEMFGSLESSDTQQW